MKDDEIRSAGLNDKDLDSDDEAPIDEIFERGGANFACMAPCKAESVCEEERAVERQAVSKSCGNLS